MDIEVSSKEELESLLAKNTECVTLPSASQVKSRFASLQSYKALVKFSLNFEPYISIASRCSMKSCGIMKSKETNRFYVGYANHGGHAPKWEIMPISHEQILNPEYIESMYLNHAQKINRAIDPGQNYEI